MKEYKEVRDILDDLINREIGKKEAETAIMNFKDPMTLTMTANSVRSIGDFTSLRNQVLVVFETDLKYEDAERIFKPGLNVNLTKSKH